MMEELADSLLTTTFRDRGVGRSRRARDPPRLQAARAAAPDRRFGRVPIKSSGAGALGDDDDDATDSDWDD